MWTYYKNRYSLSEDVRLKYWNGTNNLYSELSDCEKKEILDKLNTTYRGYDGQLGLPGNSLYDQYRMALNCEDDIRNGIVDPIEDSIVIVVYDSRPLTKYYFNFGVTLKSNKDDTIYKLLYLVPIDKDAYILTCDGKYVLYEGICDIALEPHVGIMNTNTDTVYHIPASINLETAMSLISEKFVIPMQLLNDKLKDHSRFNIDRMIMEDAPVEYLDVEGELKKFFNNLVANDKDLTEDDKLKAYELLRKISNEYGYPTIIGRTGATGIAGDVDMESTPSVVDKIKGFTSLIKNKVTK